MFISGVDYLNLSKRNLIFPLSFIFFFFVFLNISNVSAVILDTDSFNITNGAEYLNFTYCYGDYLYIVNDTQLQKWSLWSKTVSDTINFPLLTQTNEVFRKGSLLYIDATINATETLICVDIEDPAFTVLATANKTAVLTENFYLNPSVWYMGLNNIEYFECNGFDFWTWSYAYTNFSAPATFQAHIFKGTNELPSVVYQEIMISTYFYEGNNPLSNTYLTFFYHNVSAGTTGNMTWNLGPRAIQTGYYLYGQAFFNHTSNYWEQEWAARFPIAFGASTQFIANSEFWNICMNLQYDNYERGNGSFSIPELYGTFAVSGWRSNDWEWIGRHTQLNLHALWMDTENRTAYIWNVQNVNASKTFRLYEFTTAGRGTIYDPILVDQPNNEMQTHGVNAMILLENTTGNFNTYIGYVKGADSFPVADRVIEVTGVVGIRSGEVNGTFTINYAKVFAASRNLVALYQPTGSPDIVVQRNLISPANLSGGGFLPMSFHNATISTRSSRGINESLVNAGWLFEGEVYTLTAYVQNVTLARFDLTDGYNNLSFTYENASNLMYLTQDNTLVAGLIGSAYREYANETVLLNYTFVLDVNIVDILNTNLTYFIYNELIPANLSGVGIYGINIYNLGGFTEYTFYGDAGKVLSGDNLEIWAENQTVGAIGVSYAEAGTYYRRMQHANVIWGLDVEDNDCFDHHENTGQITIGFDYLENGVWTELLYAEMYIVDGAVDAAGGVGVGKAWITVLVLWWARSSNGTMTNQKSSFMSAYTECGDQVNKDISHTRFYSDLWFNTANQSTTLGARISPMFYGMEEVGGFLVWGTWSPIMFNQTSTMFFADLRNSTGDLIQPHDIELVKFRMRVLKYAQGVSTPSGFCDSHTWTITNPQFSRTQATDRMQALDTPQGVEPLVPDMPNASFLSGLTKAIQGISSMIWAGALRFIKVLWASMDTIFTWIGFPVGTFTKISDYVLTIPSYMIELIGYFSDTIVNMGTQVSRVFSIVVLIVPQLLYGSGVLVSTIISYVTQIISLFTGGWAGISNLWSTLDLVQWIELFVIAILPFWWLARIETSKDGFKTAREDVSWFFSALMSLVNLGSWLMRQIGMIIQAIRNILPV